MYLKYAPEALALQFTFVMGKSLCVFIFFVIQIAGIFFPLNSFAQDVPAAKTEVYPGYTDDVETERAQRFYEVYLFAPPPPQSNLKDAIFNPLTKEFQTRYIEKFGVVDSDSLNYRPMNYSSFDSNGGASLQVQQASDDRKDFGNYMIRRLMEYHVDNYVKTDPQMRPLYETKQKLQDVKVQVNDNIKLNLQYNFSSNIADFYVNNPWVESKISFEMAPGGFGPGNVQEYRIWLNKQLSKTLRWINTIAMEDGIINSGISKTTFWNVGTSITVSTYFHGTHGDLLRDNLYRENKLALGISIPIDLLF